MSNKKILTNDEWAHQYTSMLAEETYKLLKIKGPMSERMLSIMFLAKFTGILVYTALTQKSSAKLNKEQEYEFTSGNFKDIKSKVQDSMSTAFQASLTEFAGKHVEYYCTITPVPKSINKQPC